MPESAPAPALAKPPKPKSAAKPTKPSEPPELEPPEPEPPTGGGYLQRGTRLLRHELKRGPQNQAYLLECAAADDLTPEQLVKVAERLNIRTQKGWWRLPG